jgi:hypothetical protein
MGSDLLLLGRQVEFDGCGALAGDAAKGVPETTNENDSSMRFPLGVTQTRRNTASGAGLPAISGSCHMTG